MVSSPVFLENIKETWKKWCGIELALCLILALLILSCVPTGESLLLGLEEYFLDPALKLVSLKLTDPSVSGTVATVFFGFWALLLPTVYTLRRAEELVAEGMESGRLIVYIATPLGREKVIRTEAFSLVFGQFAMLAVSMGAGVLFAELLRPGELEIMEFLFLGLGAFAIQFVLGAFGFLISCSGMGKKLRALFLLGPYGTELCALSPWKFRRNPGAPGKSRSIFGSASRTVWRRKWSSGSSFSSAFGARLLWLCFSDFSEKRSTVWKKRN